MSLPILVFDVNETLLSLERLRVHFERLFDGKALDEWFGQLLQLAFVSTILENYQDFSILADAALRMVADRFGVALDAQQRSQILRTMAELEPHPDVAPALEMLRDHGFRLVALTNSADTVARKQLANARLDTAFEKIYSVQSVRKFKPHPATYAYVAGDLDVAAEQMILIASHGWDIAGAMHAGLGAAFVARPGKVLSPAQPAPPFIAADLRELAQTLMQTYAR